MPQQSQSLVWRALIVSIRLVIAATLAAVIGISAPAIGIADGIVTQPVVQEATSQASPSVADKVTGWFSSAWSSTSATAVEKFDNLTDPDRKIAMLKAQRDALATENAELKLELTVQDLRLQIRGQDLASLQEAVRTLNLLFVTGRMQGLVEAGQDVPALGSPK